MDIVKIIDTFPKYAQILYNDCAMQLSKDQHPVASIRKALILESVKMLRDQLDNIENHINNIDYSQSLEDSESK